MSDLTLLFWTSILILAYTYLGYPALIWLWAKLRPRPLCTGRLEPKVTVLVVAYNEGRRIVERLENLLTLDYPKELLEVILASDGSTDDTVERARAFRQAGVTIAVFRTRRGKPAVLDEMIPKAQGEIVVLADARQRFDRDVLRVLVSSFADPRVGAVSGELILTPNVAGTSAGQGVGFYWRYEKFVRRHESRVDSTVGMTGAIYAIRRNLFEPIPRDTLIDDVLIPMRIVSRGYRVLFESRAHAYDRVAATPGEEFTLKVRTMAGNFQLLTRESWLLNPFQNRLWLQVLSHKGLRLLSPVFFLTAFGVNLLAVTSPLYTWTFGGQLLFYAAALGGCLLRNSSKRLRFLSVPYVICLFQWASIVAFFRFVTGRQSVRWDGASSQRDQSRLLSGRGSVPQH